MASYINMSLDDIIQNKKKANNRNATKKKVQQHPAKNLSLMDARNKIISKKRTQITDAREKLSELAKQKDARLRLEHLRAKRLSLSKHQITQKMPRGQGKMPKSYYRQDRVFTDPSRFVVSQPLNSAKAINSLRNKKFIEHRSVEPKTLSKTTLKPIIRTIENDLEIIDDPMEYETTPSKTPLNRKASLQLKIITHNNFERSIEKDRSPPRPPSILKKRPMAALRSEEKTEKPVLEYRIIVSNLRNTVTSGDIEELFGDVGGMIESRLVRPGTAEVIYKTVEDAQRAVDLYHNRQLDGQPMNCLLVTPRSNASMSRSGSKPALYSTNSNVEPDISTFHKVLFSNF